MNQRSRSHRFFWFLFVCLCVYDIAATQWRRQDLVRGGTQVEVPNAPKGVNVNVNVNTEFI